MAPSAVLGPPYTSSQVATLPSTPKAPPLLSTHSPSCGSGQPYCEKAFLPAQRSPSMALAIPLPSNSVGVSAAQRP